MKEAKICSIVCMVLMGLLLIMQFVPFWSYDGMRTSIMGFVGLPTDHPELDAYLVAELGGTYNIAGMFITAILIFLTSLGGVVLLIAFPKYIASGIAATLCGIIGTVGFLSMKAFRLGNTWGVCLILSIGIVVASLLRGYFLKKK